MLGGECLSWSANGQEQLWERDPAIWDATAPILFPVCGWTNHSTIRARGRNFPMEVHGFARNARFVPIEQSSSHIVLRLRDDATSRVLFPYAFELTVTYRLSETALAVLLAVSNRDSAVMPYAVGLHPGFKFDVTRGGDIQFDCREDRSVPVIAAGGLFSRHRRQIDFDGHRLSIFPETFAREALCFVPSRSRGVELIHRNGRRLRVEYPDFNNLIL